MLAKANLTRIVEAVEADREQRQSTNLMIPTLYALAASVVLVVG